MNPANLPRDTAFSMFIREASEEEKHEVYMGVMERAALMQADIRRTPFSGLCCDCGKKYQTRKGTYTSTFHEGRCYCCGEIKAVTEERDFGYPVYPEHPELARQEVTNHNIYQADWDEWLAGQ